LDNIFGFLTFTR